MIELKDAVSLAISIVPLLVTIYYRKKNKGNIVIAIDYVRQKITSNKPTAVVDLPILEEKIDPLLVEITLRNKGKEPVIVDRFGIVVNTKEVILEHCTPFYYTSTRPNDSIHGGFNELQYIGDRLDKIEGLHKVKVQLKASLFLRNVKNIFIVDTLGNRWLLDKNSLDKFYVEFNENNPARGSFMQGDEDKTIWKLNNSEQTASDNVWKLNVSSIYTKYRNEIWAVGIGIFLMTGTPWWWDFVFCNKQVKEAVQSSAISKPNISENIQVKKANADTSTSKAIINKADEIVRVDTGRTASLFDGSVKVSVIGISFEGDPLRHKVTAKIDGFNMSKSLDKADVGTLVIFQDGQLIYEVRLHEIDTFTAEFSGNMKTINK